MYLPGYQFKDLGPDGGPYDQFDRPKVVVHTTQGSSIAGAESAFSRYPPHLAYDPRNRAKVQYVPLNRHSYALKNAEAEDDYVIQVEVIGFAEATHQWPDEYYKNFATDVIIPLERAINVPRQHLRFYRAGEDGHILASKYSPVRLSQAAWRLYSGWVGHQHSPNPDEHWDPGGFLMDKAFSYVPGHDAIKEDPIMVLAREKDKLEVWLGDYVQRRWVTEAELVHLIDRFGKVQIWAPGTIAVLGYETDESKFVRTGSGEMTSNQSD
jgi:hypothetical protein